VVFKIIEEIAEFLLSIACIYLVAGAYVRRYQPAWSAPLEQRRLATLSALVLAVTIVKISDDVLEGETGPIDKTILLFIHTYFPDSLIGLFEAITLTGSLRVLFPLAAVATIALLCTKRRFEALLVLASVISGAVVIYVVKTLTGRARPALWDIDWYWGSSFPSGHTLAVTVFATVIVLCVGRIKPAWRNFSMLIAVLWIFLIAISRLVLGVHWPTDVLVAVCIGSFLPLAIRVALELRDIK
jgi:undecaprenyl-diphosphatase